MYLLLRKPHGAWEFDALQNDRLVHNNINFLKHSDNVSSHFISLQWNEMDRLRVDR